MLIPMCTRSIHSNRIPREAVETITRTNCMRKNRESAVAGRCLMLEPTCSYKQALAHEQQQHFNDHVGSSSYYDGRLFF